MLSALASDTEFLRLYFLWNRSVFYANEMTLGGLLGTTGWGLVARGTRHVIRGLELSILPL